MTALGAEQRMGAVALLAAVREGADRAGALAAFMTEDDAHAYEECVAQVNADATQEDVGRRLTARSCAEHFSGIAEIHPAWILEALKGETPRIIGIIMRYLPSKQVRYLLDRLPADVKKGIPTLLESFAVPQPILEIIRARFEARFIPIHVSKAREHFDFDHVYYLKSEELELLITELGIVEVALALDGLSEKLLGVVLNRLKLKDAKRLYKSMQETKGVARELKQHARYAILEAEAHDESAERLLVDIGIESLACAMAHDDGSIRAVLCQKLDPKIVHALKRGIDERAQSLREEIVRERQALVCDAIARLASEGKIDGAWVRFAR